ncbi:MAG: metallopeptidase TldD-related protein [Terriglobia bacterium]
MQKMVSWGAGIFLLAALLLPAPARAADDVVMKAMRDELDRSMKQLQLEQLEKPYFISYRVQDRTAVDTSATFGALLSGDLSRNRFLTVQVRVGDYQRDNSNFMTYPPAANGLTENVALPLDDDYQELRRQIWLATDTAYKQALEMLSRKRAALENRKARENLPDFSKEPAATSLAPFAPIKMDLPSAEALVRNLSSLFRQAPEIYTSTVNVRVADTRAWYLNSEGSAVTDESTGAVFVAMAQTQALDGAMLPDWVVISARSMETLPSEPDLASQIRTMADRLTRVRHAPMVDRYNGPVLFEGVAGAEAISQVFAPQLLAMRTPASDNPQMEAYAAQSVSKLQDRLGARVLPRFLSLVDDPTQTSYQGTPLLGSHAVDDEGVRARPTALVDKGYLKTLLNSRDPVSGIPQSTGSFRTFGPQPSNLIFSVAEGESEQELMSQLLSMVKQRDKEFGIVVRGVGREIFKVYPDGHEEPMRLGQFDGLDDGAFKDLAAASRDLTVYSIPYAAYGGRLYPGQTAAPLVSFVAPSLLFEDLSLKPATGELPRLPLSKHPYFDK